MGWWRDGAPERDLPVGRYPAGRTGPRDAAYRNLEGDYLYLESYYTELKDYSEKLYAAYQQLQACNTNLNSAYSKLQSQNVALREQLEEEESVANEAFETAALAHAINTEFHAKLKLAVEERGVIYEAAGTLAAMHHAECHDDGLWCAECRLAFPCPSHEIAAHIVQRIDETEQRWSLS